MRDKINMCLKEAIKSKDKVRLNTIRLINAAIKDRDIAARGGGKECVDDQQIIGILSKMVKQRNESLKLYEEAGRDDLVAQEKSEIEVINEFLPKQLNDNEIDAVINQAISHTGAETLKDMGRVMSELKLQYDGQLDFSSAGKIVRERLHG